MDPNASRSERMRLVEVDGGTHSNDHRIARVLSVEPQRKMPTSDTVLSVAGILLVGLSLRPSLISIGPVLEDIRSHFGLAHWSASLLTSIPDLLMGLLALPSPWLAARYGRNRVILGALALLMLSTAVRGLAAGPVFLFSATAGVGAGIAIAGTLLSGFVKARFASRAAVMMGIYSTALSAGSAIAAVATAPLAMTFGSWRQAVSIWAVLIALGLASWVVVGRLEARPASQRLSPPVGTGLLHGLPFKSGLAWRIALYFAGTNLIFYAMVAWIASIFLEVGLSASEAGVLLGGFTIAFTITSAAIGWLSKSHDRRGWLAAGSVMCLLGLLLLAYAPGWSPLVAVSAVAAGIGIAFPLAMTLPLDNTHDSQATSAWTAFVLTIGYLIAAAGPLGVGIIRDFTGNFFGAMLLLVGIALTMLFLSPFLKPEASAHPAE